MTGNERGNVEVATQFARELGFAVREWDLRPQETRLVLVTEGFGATIEVQYAWADAAFWAFHVAFLDHGLGRDRLRTWNVVKSTLKRLHDDAAV